MTATGPAAPAGWYTDPQIPNQLRYWDGTTWTAHSSPAATPPPTVNGSPTFPYAGYAGGPRRAEARDETLIRRISDYERWTGWAWLALGIIQILTLVGVIAGAWNIYVASTRIKTAPRIANRDASVPATFEPLGGYIVLGIVNLVLGGVIGVALVVVDLFLRDQVLKNRHLFTAAPATHAAAQAPAPTAPY